MPAQSTGVPAGVRPGKPVRRSPARRLGGWAGPGAAALLVVGCGQSGRAASPCGGTARAAVARSAGAEVGQVTSTSSTDGQTTTTCDLRARPPGGAAVVATVTVDVAPQAYFRLERTVVEEVQNFVQSRLIGPPQQIPGLGLDADWLPVESRLVTTDGGRLVTVAVAWPGVRLARRIALAGSVARSFLGPPLPRAPGQSAG